MITPVLLWIGRTGRNLGVFGGELRYYRKVLR